MKDIEKFVDRWLQKNITVENEEIFPRPEHAFNELYTDAEEKGFSRDDLWKQIPDLEARVLAAFTARAKGKK
jgi:hypothetical protein